MKILEIVFHDGCIVRDGFWGRNSGTIYRLWHMGAYYDDEIAQGMNYRCWLQIKRVRKICKKNTATNKGQDGYNPSLKFHYIWRFLIHNVNFLKNHAAFDICGDETSWATDSYGEAGAGITGQISKNHGLTKGDQTVLVSDIHCVSLRVYRNRQNLHVNPPRWNVWSNIEVKEIVEVLKLMVGGE